MESFCKLALIMIMSLAFSKAQQVMPETECQWPLEKFKDLFVIACDAYNCEEKVNNCSEALVPTDDICELKDVCKTQIMGNISLPLIGNARKLPTTPDSTSQGQMLDCIMENVFKTLDIEYIPGDGVMNVVKYLNKSFEADLGYDEEFRLSMMEAIVDDICIVPEIDDEMEMLKFNFCLLKVCVDNMPDNVDYEYDENPDTEDEETE